MCVCVCEKSAPSLYMHLAVLTCRSLTFGTYNRLCMQLIMRMPAARTAQQGVRMQLSAHMPATRTAQQGAHAAHLPKCAVMRMQVAGSGTCANLWSAIWATSSHISKRMRPTFRTVRTDTCMFRWPEQTNLNFQTCVLLYTHMFRWPKQTNLNFSVGLSPVGSLIRIKHYQVQVHTHCDACNRDCILQSSQTGHKTKKKTVMYGIIIVVIAIF